MAIHLYTSNRLEILAWKCGEIFRQSPLAPLEAETIIVQSRGMAVWLTMELAGQLSVWANSRFPFPNAFVADIFRSLLLTDGQTGYDRRTAHWQIMDLLAGFREEKELHHLESWISDPLKRFQLAGQLADLFDQYIIFRPDMIVRWEHGEEKDNWQALLWREFVSRYGMVHRAELLARVLEALQGDTPAGLPRRVTLFGISSLPPFHLEIFDALSDHLPVNLFFVNPSRHWWGDIMPDRDIARCELRENKTAGDLYLESGNPLLASMGHLARDFLILLQERNCLEEDLFDASTSNSLLETIQNDILELSCSKNRLADESVVVFSCHSPMREVEALQDHLLDLFERDKSLTASDIIVMAPDIETYSSLIQAVFGLERNHPHFIPFSLADRNAGAESVLLEAFFSMLDHAGGRYPAGGIVELICSPVVSRRFHLEEGDEKRVRQWVRDLVICWGRDGQQKKELGLPPYDENTWRAGLDRLLLGYAMSDRNALFAGILPYGLNDSSDTDLLGRLLDAIETLFAWLTRLTGEYDLRQWSEMLQAMVADCFAVTGEQETEMLHLRTVLQNMGTLLHESGFAEELDLRVIKNWLQKELRQEKSPHGFLSGGVTFCSLLPMRAIPSKIVCLLGMNDGEFPRSHFTLSFDLMSLAARRGDRNPRHDDRYLFLEALLSARRQLYISYVGQSVRDDTTLPPSVLVNELLDYIKRVRGTDEKQKEDTGDVIRHRLQPFHPAYFQPGGRFFSYSAENCQAARQLVAGSDPTAGFWQGGPLPEADSVDSLDDEIQLNDFLDFFFHPIRFFCRRRLGIELTSSAQIRDDNEPFVLDGLARYQLESELVDLLVKKNDIKDITDQSGVWKARGILPHGKIGQIALREVQQEAARFYGQLATYLAPLAIAPYFRIPIQSHILCGQLNNMTGNGLLYARPANLKGKDLLRAWIEHLILHCIPGETPLRTVIVARDKTVVLQPLSPAGPVFNTLFRFFVKGMNEPMPFFVETSYRYALYACQGNLARAEKEAELTWEGGFAGGGEGEDSFLRFRYRSAENPLDQRFKDTAIEVFSPIIENYKEYNNG